MRRWRFHYRFHYTEEELNALKKAITWDDIKAKIGENWGERKTDKISDVLGISEEVFERLWYKKDLEVKTAIYWSFYTDSKIEAAVILLDRALGIEEEPLTVDMILGSMILQKIIYDLSKAMILRFTGNLQGDPKVATACMVLPHVVNGEIEEGEENRMYG